MTVIDLRALGILTTVSVGRSPTGLAVNPRKNEIYVANTESNNISVIEAETNKVVSTIGVHRAPFFIDVSRDGKRAYVANSGSANLVGDRSGAAHECSSTFPPATAAIWRE